MGTIVMDAGRDEKVARVRIEAMLAVRGSAGNVAFVSPSADLLLTGLELASKGERTRTAKNLPLTRIKLVM